MYKNLCSNTTQSQSQSTEEAATFIRDGVAKLQNGATDESQTTTQAKVDLLQTGLMVVEKIGKPLVLPSSPTKGTIIGVGSVLKKKKRGFLYLVYQFLEGGIWCPYVKIG